jgi:hypothetical protein
MLELPELSCDSTRDMRGSVLVLVVLESVALA